MGKKIVFKNYKVIDGRIQLQIKDDSVEIYNKEWKELIWKKLKNIKINAHDIYWLGILDEHMSYFLNNNPNLKNYYSDFDKDNIDYYEIRGDLASNVWLEKFKILKDVGNDPFWIKNGLALENNVQEFITKKIDSTAKFNVSWDKEEFFHGEYDGEGENRIYEIKTVFVDNLKLYIDTNDSINIKKDKDGKYLLRKKDAKIDKIRIETYGRKNQDGTKTFTGFHLPMTKIEYIYQVYMYKYASNKDFTFFILLYSLDDYYRGLENFKINYVDNKNNTYNKTYTNNGINLIANPYFPCCAKGRTNLSDFYDSFCTRSIPWGIDFYKKHIITANSPKMSKENLIKIEQAFYSGREEE